MSDPILNDDVATPSAEQEPHNPFIFPTGNICLLVKHDGRVVEGKVSSDSLCQASPVWKKFLFPPWKDHDLPHSIKQIDCTEDDSNALLILLNICHLKFKDVPQSLNYRNLLQVTILCDQYDCVDVVRPWLLPSMWLAYEEAESLKLGQERWLFIAWVFGRTQVFEKLAAHMVMNMNMHTSGEVTWLKMTPMPPGIIESILSCRKNLIDSLLRIPYSMLDRYEIVHMPYAIGITPTYTQRSKTSVCTMHGSSQPEACDALIYGSLVFRLGALRLFPRRKVEDLLLSVTGLSLALKATKLREYPKEHPTFGQPVTHEKCRGKEFSEQVDEVLAKPFDPVLEMHRMHLKALNS
ncbi:uncharacterized protein LY89DRAFT_743852 [Mollisia scopiformis]|uniref:BTB domain-containing protein n=1 Tax=Mollisia scopiformis TaxID=149040 RepID=A0A132B2A2_MOLSC|nr:uncharacterized protein LY89DRAFT_743852 [Mollisia scopiformis]KUJ06373.1 hypothetical protein LY89DRAFT_743852 [Mollisia scopiformis]